MRARLRLLLLLAFFAFFAFWPVRKEQGDEPVAQFGRDVRLRASWCPSQIRPRCVYVCVCARARLSSLRGSRTSTRGQGLRCARAGVCDALEQGVRRAPGAGGDTRRSGEDARDAVLPSSVSAVSWCPGVPQHARRRAVDAAPNGVRADRRAGLCQT